MGRYRKVAREIGRVAGWVDGWVAEWSSDVLGVLAVAEMIIQFIWAVQWQK